MVHGITISSVKNLCQHDDSEDFIKPKQLHGCLILRAYFFYSFYSIFYAQLIQYIFHYHTKWTGLTSVPLHAFAFTKRYGPLTIIIICISFVMKYGKYHPIEYPLSETSSLYCTFLDKHFYCLLNFV